MREGASRRGERGGVWDVGCGKVHGDRFVVCGVWRVWVSLAKNAPRSGTRGCMGSTRARGERDGVLGDGWSAARWAMAEEERGGEKPSVEQRGGVRGREDRVSDTPRYARPRRALGPSKI